MNEDNSFQVALEVKTYLPTQEIQETQVQSLGQEDHLEEEMATHSSALAWKILWREEPGGLQSIDCKESDRNEANEHPLYQAPKSSHSSGLQMPLF